jgi:hypothetical protein
MPKRKSVVESDAEQEVEEQEEQEEEKTPPKPKQVSISLTHRHTHPDIGQTIKKPKVEPSSPEAQKPTKAKVNLIPSFWASP